ncbi:hypothetical protein HMPREF9440_01561 [Sutterella parvirubra YIT 11816]|uniref:Uncharacterized protein n=1 Tax=Sutterella parvirubra YIT 11816 TaxID=762967 RepID=H3KFP2_9BURK|nr:hypothetical protein HMPREF9440_01561 [Sutterella parvirubra YIT 11816]
MGGIRRILAIASDSPSILRGRLGKPHSSVLFRVGGRRRGGIEALEKQEFWGTRQGFGGREKTPELFPNLRGLRFEDCRDGWSGWGRPGVFD